MIIWSTLEWVEVMKYAVASMLELVEMGGSGNVGVSIPTYMPSILIYSNWLLFLCLFYNNEAIQ